MGLRTYTIAEAAVITMVGSVVYFLLVNPVIPDNVHLPFGPWRTPMERAEGPNGRVAGLTREGTLFVVNLEDGKVEFGHDLGNTASYWFSSSLAVSPDGDEVYAAAVDSATHHTKVFAMSLTTQAVRKMMTIRDSIGYPWIEVGPESGKLYLFSERGIRIVIADRSGNQLRRDSMLLDSNRDARVTRARVSPDERRFYVSFGDRLDWVEFRDGNLARCPKPASRDACIVGKFLDFDFVRGNLIAATEGPNLASIDSAGSRIRGLPSGLARMWVARLGVDTATRTAYVLGAGYYMRYCFEHGTGPSAGSLDGNLDTPRRFPDNACGSRIAVPSSRGWLAVATFDNQLVIFDAKRGGFLGWIDAPGEVQSLVAID